MGNYLRKIIKPYYKPQRISLILTILAILFWSLNLKQAELVIGFYGLIHSFSPAYFVAMVLLTLASIILWLSNENNWKLLCLQVCLLIIFLYVTPLLIGSNPVSAQWTYSTYYSSTAGISQTGHLDLSFYWVQNWPTISILESTMEQIFGLCLVDFTAKWSVVILHFLFLFPVYSFFKNTIKQANYRWAACWFFYIANWTSQIYFSSQAFGLFLLITLLALLMSTKFLKIGPIQVNQYICIILILAALSVTHALTSILCLLCLLLFWATRQFKYTNLIIIFGIFIATWSIYGAASQLDYHLPKFLDRAFNFEMVFRFAATRANQNMSDSYTAVSYIRYIYSAIFVIITIIGFILSRKYKDERDHAILFIEIPAVIVLVSMLYGNEYWIRTFLFSLIPMAYFSVKLLKTRITAYIFCLILIIAVPFSTVSFYGNAIDDYQPRGEVAYWHFMNENATNGELVGGLKIRSKGFINNVDDRFLPNYKQVITYPNKTSVITPQYKHASMQYIHIGDVDEAKYNYYYNDLKTIPEILKEMENSQIIDLTYTNPNVNLYTSSGQIHFIK